MTKADLLERVAFWQVDLMDVDHLRDVAYEAMSGGFDGQEFRQIAGDARLSTDDARELVQRALRAAGIEMIPRETAERIVCASIARSILAEDIDPLWGAAYISQFTYDVMSSPAFNLLVRYSCPCCNGLDEMLGVANRAARRALCRQEIRNHLQKYLPEIESWAGVPPSGDGERPGFLGWRRSSDSIRSELRDIERKIRWVLLRFWDPIGVSHAPEAKDEYDGYITRIRSLLVASGPDGEIATPLAEHLRVSQVERMGIPDDETTARRRQVTVEELLALRSSW